MFVLASASPRRRELLGGVGLAFVVRAADIDESRRPGEDPRAYALRIATEKAAAVSDDIGGFSVPVLAADTTVALDGEVLDKPGTADRARDTLRRLSGATHSVHTALVLRRDPRRYQRVVTTTVRFRKLGEAEIDRYVSTGEPLDRAGAYAIQGGAGGFVHRVHGSYTGVVGLPLAEALAMLARVGVRPR